MHRTIFDSGIKVSLETRALRNPITLFRGLDEDTKREISQEVFDLVHSRVIPKVACQNFSISECGEIYQYLYSSADFEESNMERACYNSARYDWNNFKMRG